MVGKEKVGGDVPSPPQPPSFMGPRLNSDGGFGGGWLIPPNTCLGFDRSTSRTAGITSFEADRDGARSTARGHKILTRTCQTLHMPTRSFPTHVFSGPPGPPECGNYPDRRRQAGTAPGASAAARSRPPGQRHDDSGASPSVPTVPPAGPDAALRNEAAASPFVRTQRAVDTLIAAFLWLHVPLIAGISWARGGAWMAPAGLATLIAVTAAVMRVMAHGARVTRLTMAVAFVAMVSTLLVAMAGSALQVDLHMYYFVAMAVVAAYCDPGVILAAAAATMLHHLVLNVAMPSLVFPGGSDLGRAMLHAVLVVLEAGALFWMTRRVTSAFAASEAALAQSQVDRLALQAKTARAEMLLRNNLRLRVLSDTDGLTGIGNRRFFDDRLARAWAKNAGDVQTVGMLLMDIDHFKVFNDRYGHLVGDRCLRLVADRLSSMIRQDEDILARFGGEEFALILPCAPLARVQAVGERIRLGVEGLVVPLETGTCGVSISIGCASIVPVGGVKAAALIAAADVALYCAKNAGRNCIHPAFVAGEPSMT